MGVRVLYALLPLLPDRIACGRPPLRAVRARGSLPCSSGLLPRRVVVGAHTWCPTPWRLHAVLHCAVH